MATNLDKKMLIGFSHEVRSYLPSIREGIGNFRHNATQRESLEEALRYIHTIKGASALMGLSELSRLTAYIEEMLEEIVAGQSSLNPEQSTWLSHTVDQIDPYLDSLLSGTADEQAIITEIEQSFQQLKTTSAAANVDGRDASMDRGEATSALVQDVEESSSEQNTPEATLEDMPCVVSDVTGEGDDFEITLAQMPSVSPSLSTEQTDLPENASPTDGWDKLADKDDLTGLNLTPLVINDVEELVSESDEEQTAPEAETFAWPEAGPEVEGITAEKPLADDLVSPGNESDATPSASRFPTMGKFSETANAPASVETETDRFLADDEDTPEPALAAPVESAESANGEENLTVHLPDDEPISGCTSSDDRSLADVTSNWPIPEDEVDVRSYAQPMDVGNEEEAQADIAEHASPTFMSQQVEESEPKDGVADDASPIEPLDVLSGQGAESEESCWLGAQLAGHGASEQSEAAATVDDLSCPVSPEFGEEDMRDESGTGDLSGAPEDVAFTLPSESPNQHEFLQYDGEVVNAVPADSEATLEEAITTQNPLQYAEQSEELPQAFRFDDLPPAAPGALDALMESIDSEVRRVYSRGALTAARQSSTDHTSMSERYLLFTLAGCWYAVPVLHILEIGRVPRITPVPNVPVWIPGVINLRGEILSVIDLRLLFGLEKTPQAENGRMLVVKADSDEIVTSLVVDQVRGFVRIDAVSMQALALPADDKLAPYLRGVYEYDDQALAIVDLERFLISPTIRQFD